MERHRNPAGCTINLEEGAHRYGDHGFGLRIEDQTAEWLKITAAPSADPALVRITSTATEGIRGYPIWFDNLSIEISATMPGGPRNESTGTRYCRTSRLSVVGVEYAGQVRDVHYTKLGEDGIPNALHAFNIIVDEIDRGSQGDWRPDLIPLYSVNEILIYQDIRASSCNARARRAAHLAPDLPGRFTPFSKQPG